MTCLVVYSFQLILIASSFSRFRMAKGLHFTHSYINLDIVFMASKSSLSSHWTSGMIAFYLIGILILIHVSDEAPLIECSNNCRTDWQWIHIYACTKNETEKPHSNEKSQSHEKGGRAENGLWCALPWFDGPFWPFGLIPSDCKFGMSRFPRLFQLLPPPPPPPPLPLLP